MKLFATVVMPDLVSALARLNQTQTSMLPALPPAKPLPGKRKIFRLARRRKKS